MNTKNIIGSFVLIRSEQSGVHFGILSECSLTPAGIVVLLENAQRIWYWQGANTLNEVSLLGVDKGLSKISKAVDRIIIGGVCEILFPTKQAQANLKGCKWSS